MGCKVWRRRLSRLVTAGCKLSRGVWLPGDCRGDREGLVVIVIVTLVW